LHTKSPCKL